MFSEYLAKNGIARWIETAIALAESVSEKNVAGSPIPIWLPFDIERRAAALTTMYPPNADELARVNDLLRRRADAQRAVEEGTARRRRSRSRPY